MQSQFSPVFIKARALALGCLSIGSLLWVILLSVALFSQWAVLDKPERSLILIMLGLHTITIVMLLVLLIATFRPWLDAARIILLFAAHIAVNGAFAYWFPRFKCLAPDIEGEGVCKFIIAYVLIASWITPVLLVTYGAGLAFMVWRRRMITSGTVPPIDAEKGTASRPSVSYPSVLDLTSKSSSRVTLSTFPFRVEHLSSISGISRNSAQEFPVSDHMDSKSINVRVARLSKPPPAFHL